MSKYGYSHGDNDDYYLTTNFIIAARGNYHFIFHDKLDTYAGIGLGVDMSASKWKGCGSDPNSIMLSTAPFGGRLCRCKMVCSLIISPFMLKWAG